MPTKQAVKLWLINLAGGGGDHACTTCLPEAKRDLTQHDEILSVGEIATGHGDVCQWCGWDGD